MIRLLPIALRTGLVPFLLAIASSLAVAESVDFNRDIRPILSNNCFSCHGPDAAERKGGDKKTGGLRLDVRKSAIIDLGGYAAIAPGDAEGSELMVRVLSEDSDEVMPPPKAGKRLSREDADLLKRWIDEEHLTRATGHT